MSFCILPDFGIPFCLRNENVEKIILPSHKSLFFKFHYPLHNRQSDSFPHALKTPKKNCEELRNMIFSLEGMYNQLNIVSWCVSLMCQYRSNVGTWRVLIVLI